MTDPKGKRMTAGEEGAALSQAFPMLFQHKPNCPKLSAAGDPQCICTPEYEREKALRDHITALEAENKTLREERDGFEADYLRRHKDACDLKDQVLALTRPPSDAEVGKAEKEAARSVRFQLGGPFAVGLSEKERIEFDAKAARLAKVAAAPFTDLIRRLAQANKTLPDWNTLSNEARDAMKEAAGFHVSDVWAAQCALDVYNAGRRALSTQETKR